MKKVLLILVLLVLTACSSSPVIKDGFCGSSSMDECTSNSDCSANGCSGQVCQSINEEGMITTCEWRDCYASVDYGLECGCVDSKCQWN